jgi:hypothetical protein
MNYHKKMQIYNKHPVIRRNQFIRLPDEQWKDADGMRWMRARAFVPSFAETLQDETVMRQLLVDVPEAIGGGQQYWVLLKSKQAFDYVMGDVVLFDNQYRKIMSTPLYDGKHRTVLVELL